MRAPDSSKPILLLALAAEPPVTKSVLTLAGGQIAHGTGVVRSPN